MAVSLLLQRLSNLVASINEFDCGMGADVAGAASDKKFAHEFILTPFI